MPVGGATPGEEEGRIMAFAGLSRSKQTTGAPTRLAKGKSRLGRRDVGSRPGFVGSVPRLGAAPSPHPSGLQTKLKVGEPSDKFEQEADRAADLVVGTAELGGRLQAAPLIRHRLTGADGGGEAPPIVHAALRSPGRPLDMPTRAFMESRFNHDFSQVRVHTDPLAAESARAMGALAYTAGQHLVFAPGRYSPASQGGRKIIAHELAHEVQQQALPPAHGKGEAPSAEGTHLQRFADSLAGWVGGPGDDSAMEINLRYKVFDATGRAITDSPFTSASHRPSITLTPGSGYVIQIIGSVSVLRDVTGPDNEHNQWDIRIDWPVTVDPGGTIVIRPTVPNVSGGAGDAPWSLAYGDIMDRDTSTVGLSLSLSSTESTTTTYTGTVGLSQGAEVGVEGAAEPGGVGGAVSGSVSGGASEEVAVGREFTRGATLTRQLGLLLDLVSTRPPPTVEVGPIRIARDRVVEFRSGEGDFTGAQRDELVRSFLALDPEPDPFRQRGEGLRILIEGYASNLGEPDFNRDLSQRRAEFVAEIARATLPGANIPTPGFLGEAPWADLADTDDEQAHRVATVRIIDDRATLE
jgi:outer membrane protein OmpA-like peptidoglycan-associated protein